MIFLKIMKCENKKTKKQKNKKTKKQKNKKQKTKNKKQNQGPFKTFQGRGWQRTDLPGLWQIR